MPKVYIDIDEMYPFMRIVKSGKFGRSAELTEEELQWYDSTMKDFWELQDFLVKKYDKDWPNE